MTNEQAHHIAMLSLARYRAYRELREVEDAWKPGDIDRLRDAGTKHSNAVLALEQALEVQERLISFENEPASTT